MSVIRCLPLHFCVFWPLVSQPSCSTAPPSNSGLKAAGAVAPDMCLCHSNNHTTTSHTRQCFHCVLWVPSTRLAHCSYWTRPSSPCFCEDLYGNPVLAAWFPVLWIYWFQIRGIGIIHLVWICISEEVPNCGGLPKWHLWKVGSWASCWFSSAHLSSPSLG